MCRLRIYLLPLVFSAFVFAGCDAFSSDDEDTAGSVVLTGQILNSLTNNPVEDAYVKVLPYDLLFEADEQGSYEFAVDIDSTMDLQIQAGATGFSTASVSVLAVASRLIEVPTLRLTATVEEEAESGRAHSILLQGQSGSSIGVRESGSIEVATLTFQVVDSVGRPVILDNSTLINFSFGANPGGEASLAPASAETDNNGVASVTLTSGTTAGAVQVMAETTVDGRLIRSQPVAVTIHGGLPDQTHFSIGPERFNFPGLNIFGLENPISVIVGDQYANPVRTGTSVYFTTSHAVIEGSITTDVEGRGTVNLISGNPLPADGIGLVTATTADRNQQTVIGQTPVIFSGVPVLTLTPAVVAVGTTYFMTVTDQNGNPLAEGTSISVKVEGTAVKAVGNTAVELDDSAFIGGVLYEHVLRGPGITEFTFRAAPDIDPTATNPPTPVVEAITITIAGPNGRLEVALSGGAGKTGSGIQVSEDAMLEHISTGIRVTAPVR